MGSFHEVSFPNRPETDNDSNKGSNVFHSFTMRIVYFSPCKSKYFRYLRNEITTIGDYVRKVNRLRNLELTVFIICVDKSVVILILSRNVICHAVAL